MTANIFEPGLNFQKITSELSFIYDGVLRSQEYVPLKTIMVPSQNPYWSSLKGDPYPEI